MQQFQRFATTCAVLLTAFATAGSSAEPTSTLLDDPRAVPYYTGQLYPIPKQVTYHKTVLPLRDVGVVLGKGFTPDDARLTVLTDRISRYGGQVRVLVSATEACETLILMGNTVVHSESARKAKLPAHAEGYLVHTTEHDGQHRVFLEGHDFHGLLWAIVAFNQMVALDSEGQPVAHGLTVADYPDYPGVRGYTAMIDDPQASRAWLAVNVMRANKVIYRQLRDINDWRSPMRDEARFDAWQEKIRAISDQLTPLKIEWYDSILPLSPSDPTRQIRSKSEEDLELVVRAAKALAEAGGHLCLLYDDFRFPMHDDDERDFDTAAKADVYFINRVYEAVSAEYPDFKILFCPPFYWGPLSDPSEAYGEPREEYLAALGTLPKAVDIYWTGPRVKSREVTPTDIAWYTDLIQRPPVYWQNTAGVSHGSVFYIYPTDPIPAWGKWYDAEFGDQITAYAYNQADPYTNLTLFDALWNREGYDAETSSQLAAQLLVGPDQYEALVEGFELLESLDAYGWFKPTAMAAKNIDEVRAKTDELIAFVQQAPAPLRYDWTSLGFYTSLKQTYVSNLESSPNLKALTEIDDIVRQMAVAESGADVEGHVVLTPNDFIINRSPGYYKPRQSDRRFAVWVYGQQTPASKMHADFILPYSISRHSDLIVSGLNHNIAPACRIRIDLNGRTVFEGENPFASDEWTRHTFSVEGAFLRDGVNNRLTITNTEDSDNVSGAPWFMLNYAVLRPQD